MLYDWSRIWALALTHKKNIVQANVIAILATLAAVPVPFLLPVLVDEVLLHQPGWVMSLMQQCLPESLHAPAFYIGFMVIVALLLRLINLAFSVWQARHFAIISKDVVFRLRQHMLSRLQRISMAEYETLGSGSVASYFVTDLETIDRFLGTSISRFFVALLTIIGTAAILLWMHWQLALLIIVFNPVVIYFTTRLGKQVKALKKEENKAFQVFQSALTETLDAIQQVRASNRETFYLQRLTSQARDVRDFAINFEWKSDAASRASFTIFQFGIDFFRAAAMLTVLFSDLSVGMMFAFFSYLWFMMLPMQEILTMQYSYYAANAALERVNHLFDLRDEPHYPPTKNPFEETGAIAVRLEDIHFVYRSQSEGRRFESDELDENEIAGNDLEGAGSDSEVLKGVSLDIEPGETVALVGASGGGKSTLVQVMLGLYKPSRGRVLFNEVPLEDIGLDVVRENVATVLQQPALFNDTVRENLAMGREIADADLWHALTIAQLKGVVEAMPDGLSTLIGRQGIRLSGGQRQRLAVARMILTDPAVVILDEATSALDAETEFQLHDALRQFLKNRTTIIIAHRLSAVKQADRVYVFEDGLVAEEGRHDVLIEQGGLYSQLYGVRQQ